MGRSSVKVNAAKADIFLSYAKEDFAVAKNIAEALESGGLSVWWDRKIPAGRVFEDVIEEAINSASCVVVLWSESSVNSDWVKTEANEGHSRKTLVPVSLDDSRIPLAFRHIQTANFREWNGNCESDVIKELAESIRHVTARAHQNASDNVVSINSREIDIQALKRNERLPENIDAVVIEQDTGLVLNPDDEIRYPKESVKTLTREMLSRGEPEQGTVLVLGTSPPQLLAVVHNLDSEPTWTESIVNETMHGLLKIAKRRGFSSIATPLLGTVHGDLEKVRARELLDKAVATMRVPTLRRIWILEE